MKSRSPSFGGRLAFMVKAGIRQYRPFLKSSAGSWDLRKGLYGRGGENFQLRSLRAVMYCLRVLVMAWVA